MRIVFYVFINICIQLVKVRSESNFCLLPFDRDIAVRYWILRDKNNFIRTPCSFVCRLTVEAFKEKKSKYTIFIKCTDAPTDDGRLFITWAVGKKSFIFSMIYRRSLVLYMRRGVAKMLLRVAIDGFDENSGCHRPPVSISGRHRLVMMFQ